MTKFELKLTDLPEILEQYMLKLEGANNFNESSVSKLAYFTEKLKVDYVNKIIYLTCVETVNFDATEELLSISSLSLNDTVYFSGVKLEKMISENDLITNLISEIVVEFSYKDISFKKVQEDIIERE